MLKTLTALAALAVVSTSAIAADMPRKAPLQEQQYTAKYWDGIYLGVKAGWASIDTNPSIFTGTSSPSGLTYGGDLRYLKQFGVLVVGFETSITNFSGVKTNGLGCDCLVADFVAKVGFTPTPQTLIYGLGGGFWHNGVVQSRTTTVPDFGWEVGAGAAWKPFDNHIEVGLEYRYRNLDFPNNLVGFNVFSHEVMAKVGYQF